MRTFVNALILFAALVPALALATAEPPVTCSTSKCHSEMGKASFVHGPLKSKGCHVCHEVLDASAPKHPKLAVLSKSQTNQRCFVCHESFPAKLKQLKHLHGAIDKDSCTGCHDPHQSEHKFILKKDPKLALCLDCHKKTITDAGLAKHHKIADMKEGCLSCHATHGAPHAKLMKAASPSALCLKCHEEPVKAADGRTIESIKPWLTDAPFKHEPVAKGECVKCHGIHGSEKANLLPAPYSSDFYAPYEQKDVALCFECHKPELVTTRKASSETGFRNGETNLHSLHVLGQKKQRSCRVCHEVHAAHQEKLVRSSFNYKNLELPILFRRTEGGGSCTTACHSELKYDRNKAIVNEKNKAH